MDLGGDIVAFVLFEGVTPLTVTVTAGAGQLRPEPHLLVLPAGAHAARRPHRRQPHDVRGRRHGHHPGAVKYSVVQCSTVHYTMTDNQEMGGDYGLQRFVGNFGAIIFAPLGGFLIDATSWDLTK